MEAQKMPESMDSYRFGAVDHTVLLGVTIVSIATGLYFGWIKKYKKNAEIITPTVVSSEESMANLGSEKMNEYLMGSRNLKVVPVGMSLIASYTSGVTILGTPSEIYYNGTQYSLIVVVIIRTSCFLYIFACVFGSSSVLVI